MPNAAFTGRAIFLALLALLWAPSANVSGGLAPVPREQLCVTKGTIEAGSGTQLKVSVPEMRAVLLSQTPQRIEAHLTYLGPSQGEKRLKSGELRRQFGLKLRAANGCNLVYVMWRIAPKAGIVVSVKSNPGLSTNAECGTNGYTEVKPEWSSPAPLPRKGKSHTLRAELGKSDLEVWIDQKLVWLGDVGQAALAFDGPVGVRSDNGGFEFELFAPAPVSDTPVPCHASNEDE
jgi:hypothetical protein